MFNMGPSRPMNGMSPQGMAHARPGGGMINKINNAPPPSRPPMGGGMMRPPTGDPRMMFSGGQLPGGGMDGGGMTMPPPQIPMQTGMGGTGGMMLPPPSGGGLIGQLTGGMNTGVAGPQMGQSSLWGNYNNMVQGDGAPQKRNLIY